MRSPSTLFFHYAALPATDGDVFTFYSGRVSADAKFRFSSPSGFTHRSGRGMRDGDTAREERRGSIARSYLGIPSGLSLLFRLNVRGEPTRLCQNFPRQRNYPRFSWWSGISKKTLEGKGWSWAETNPPGDRRLSGVPSFWRFAVSRRNCSFAAATIGHLCISAAIGTGRRILSAFAALAEDIIISRPGSIFHSISRRFNGV